MSVMPPEQPVDPAKFGYQFKSGARIELPKFKSILTFGRARRYRHMAEDQVIFPLLEELCDDAALAVLDEMDGDETEAFSNAWQKDAGVSLGESSGSSPSSTSTAPASTTTGGTASDAPSTPPAPMPV